MSKIKKFFLCFSVILSFFLIFSCQGINDNQGLDDAAVTAGTDKEITVIQNIYNEALTSNDPALIDKFIAALEAFDAKYQGAAASDFKNYLDLNQTRLTDPLANFPPLTDLPLLKDGDVYLSGGPGSLASYIIDWVSPGATPGKYYHGAILDIDKFDPTNLDLPCFQTAVQKGAGYESAMDWMTKGNVAVMTPIAALNRTALNAAQARMDYYCDPNNTNMVYGFFESYVNVFTPVSKTDNYNWYCTKVIWRIYNELGINIDSNSALIDWTTSGLYSVLKTYYYTIYFWSPTKAKTALLNHINLARSTLVLAEEIYFSPYLQLIYEKVRS